MCQSCQNDEFASCGQHDVTMNVIGHYSNANTGAASNAQHRKPATGDSDTPTQHRIPWRNICLFNTWHPAELNDTTMQLLDPLLARDFPSHTTSKTSQLLHERNCFPDTMMHSYTCKLIVATMRT